MIEIENRSNRLKIEEINLTPNTFLKPFEVLSKKYLDTDNFKILSKKVSRYKYF